MLGKCHGAASDSDNVGPAPAAADIEEQGLGWANAYQTGVGPDAITSGIELVWTKNPTQWTNGYLNSLWGNEWSLEKGPGGAYQWIAPNGTRDYPKAFDNTTFDLPKMLTSDIALREDAIYANITLGWKNDFDGLTNAFAHSWYVPNFSTPLCFRNPWHTLKIAHPPPADSVYIPLQIRNPG